MVAEPLEKGLGEDIEKSKVRLKKSSRVVMDNPWMNSSINRSRLWIFMDDILTFFVARNFEVYCNIAATCWSSNVWLLICIAHQGYWCHALLKMTGPYEKQTEMMLDSRPDHWIVSKPCRSALNGTRGVSAISSQRTMIGTGLLPQSGKGHIYCNWMYSVCLVHHLYN